MDSKEQLRLQLIKLLIENESEGSSCDLIDRAARLEDYIWNGIKSKPVVIETHEEDKVSWGVSFTGPNPKPENFVECTSSEDAYRLLEIINERLPRL